MQLIHIAVLEAPHLNTGHSVPVWLLIKASKTKGEKGKNRSVGYQKDRDVRTVGKEELCKTPKHSCRSSENNMQDRCCQKLHLDMFCTNFRGKSNKDETLKEVKRK